MARARRAVHVVEAGRIHEDVVQQRRVVGRRLGQQLAAAVQVRVDVVQAVAEDGVRDGRALQRERRVRVQAAQLEDGGRGVGGCLLLLAEGAERADDGGGGVVADGQAGRALVRGDAHEDDGRAAEARLQRGGFVRRAFGDGDAKGGLAFEVGEGF